MGKDDSAPSVTTELVDDDADFAQRAAELKALLPEPGPGSLRFAAASCDGCGTRAALDFDSPRLPPGWASCGDGDYCPRCQALN